MNPEDILQYISKSAQYWSMRFSNYGLSKKEMEHAFHFFALSPYRDTTDVVSLSCIFQVILVFDSSNSTLTQSEKSRIQQYFAKCKGCADQITDSEDEELKKDGEMFALTKPLWDMAKKPEIQTTAQEAIKEIVSALPQTSPSQTTKTSCMVLIAAIVPLPTLILYLLS